MIEHWAELYTANARAFSVSQHVIYAQRFVPCVTGAIALALALAVALYPGKTESQLTLCISEERFSDRRHRPQGLYNIIYIIICIHVCVFAFYDF